MMKTTRKWRLGGEDKIIMILKGIVSTTYIKRIKKTEQK